MASHAGNTGSIPVGVTNNKNKGLSIIGSPFFILEISIPHTDHVKKTVEL